MNLLFVLKSGKNSRKKLARNVLFPYVIVLYQKAEKPVSGLFLCCGTQIQTYSIRIRGGNFIFNFQRKYKKTPSSFHSKAFFSQMQLFIIHIFCHSIHFGKKFNALQRHLAMQVSGISQLKRHTIRQMQSHISSAYSYCSLHTKLQC